MIDLGIYIEDIITRLSHTESGVIYMLSCKVACNPSIEYKRSRLDHTEAGATDMLSFNVARNPPGNVLAEISGIGGPWE